MCVPPPRASEAFEQVWDKEGRAIRRLIDKDRQRGRNGRHRCHVRGTSAQPNKKHCRLPIRKPPKPLTVNWKKKMAAIKIGLHRYWVWRPVCQCRLRGGLRCCWMYKKNISTETLLCCSPSLKFESRRLSDRLKCVKGVERHIWHPHFSDCNFSGLLPLLPLLSVYLSIYLSTYLSNKSLYIYAAWLIVSLSCCDWNNSVK